MGTNLCELETGKAEHVIKPNPLRVDDDDNDDDDDVDHDHDHDHDDDDE